MKNMQLVAVVSLIGVALLGGSYLYIKGSIHQNQKHVATLSNEISEMKSKAEEEKEKQLQYKGQVEELETELFRYQPIVVPE